ncbi:hypothetical protein K2X05_04005, partial [bacterium]|nr:hypothetical protein [bacterium]
MKQKGKLSYIRSFILLFFTFSLVTLFQNCGSQFETPDNSSNTANQSEEPAPTQQCAVNMHLENNVCTNDKRACTVSNGTAEETWNGSMYGACTVVSCNAGYRNQSNSCVFSPTSCPIANGNGQTQSNGSCQVVSCNTNYHINGNMCSSNIQLCPVANGAGQSVWNGSAFGPCTVISCNMGYMNMGNTCVANTPTGSFAWMPRNSTRFFLSGHSLTDDPLAD